MAQIKDLKRMCASYTGCLNCELYVNGCIKIYELPDNAEEILERKCLAPCVVHTPDRGDIMTTMKIK